jgi:hypothetical protein
MTLGSRAFFREFLLEFDAEKNKVNWELLYERPSEWTAKMLGTSRSRKTGDYGLIGRIGQEFGYEIDAEWRNIDQVWYIYLPELKKGKDTPWRDEVLIEHENDAGRLEYTFYKFNEIAAPLKVGIFFPRKGNEEERLEKCREMILKQVSYFPGETYLVIFGFQDAKTGVYWHAYEIDFKGNVTKLHK